MFNKKGLQNSFLFVIIKVGDSMFDIIETLLIQLINFMPFLICLILIMNLIASLLWGDR